MGGRSRGRAARSSSAFPVRAPPISGASPTCPRRSSGVLSPAELERRLDLLRACWAYFDAAAARVQRPPARSSGRRAQPRADRPPRLRQLSGAVLAQGRGPNADQGRPDLGRPGGPSGAYLDAIRCPQRRRQTSADLADPIPRAPHGASCDGSCVGAGGPGLRILIRVGGRRGASLEGSPSSPSVIGRLRLSASCVARRSSASTSTARPRLGASSRRATSISRSTAFLASP